MILFLWGCLPEKILKLGVIALKISFKREKIAEGIHYSFIRNENLKTNSTVINFILPISEETASDRAAAAYVLSESSSEYKTLTEISSKLESLYGAGLRGTVLSLGDNQMISLMGGCINDRFAFDKENVTEELARVMLGCLLSPNLEGDAFSEADFNLKKQELLNDIDADINEKRSYAMMRAWKITCKGEPAAVLAKGERADAERITNVSAYARYKELLKTAQIEIFFVGADEPEKVKDMLCGGLLKLERDYKGDVTNSLSPVKEKPLEVVEKLDVVQCKMVIAFKSDYGNKPAVKLMNAVFGATPFSKLFLNVREKLSLCYYCASRYYNLKGVITVDSGVEEANIEKAKEEILRQLENMKNGDFDEKDINEARLSLVNSIRGVNDSAAGLVSWYNGGILEGNIRSPEEEIAALERVTKEDIIEAAKSFKLDTVYVLKGSSEE